MKSVPRLVRSSAQLLHCRPQPANGHISVSTSTSSSLSGSGAQRRHLSGSTHSRTASNASSSRNPVPNEGHALDPALQQLLRDADLSLLKSRRRAARSIAPSTPSGVEHLEVLDEDSAERRYDAMEEDGTLWEGEEDEGSVEDDINAWHNRDEKRSTEAIFGSKHIGLSSIPEELDEAIAGLINESDKHQLRSDAKRLFLKPSSRDRDSEFDNEWTSELPSKFKESKRRKSARVTPREALTYTVIAVPAQYAALRNVLRETRVRLGEEWARGVKGVVDFGSGTGVGMWAALNEFKNPTPINEGVPVAVELEAEPLADEPSEPAEAESTTDFASEAEVDALIDASAELESEPGSLSQSSIQHYLLLENRRALLSVSKKLTKDLSFGSTRVQVEDFWGNEGRKMDSSPEGTLAVMAFTLSDLPTDLSRRLMLREMWNTGADTMIVIDHATEAGFAHVAAARDYLLKKGRYPSKEDRHSKEVFDFKHEVSAEAIGSHVVAPCPHDGVCPMTLLVKAPSTAPSKPYHKSKTVSPVYTSSSAQDKICSFTQRLERPAFLRKTKHASKGHEFIQYSYVVVRRGPGPAPPKDTVLWDPIPLSPRKERKLKKIGVLTEIPASRASATTASSSTTESPEAGAITTLDLNFEEVPDTPADIRRRSRHWISDAPPRDMEDIRSESFYWPRIVQPPLKRSGHILLETCTKEGNIARHTIPKSQGKQHYYDARKAKWGDSFPWESKNGPDVRRRGRPLDASAPAEGNGASTEEPSDDTPLEELEGEWEMSFGPDGQPKLTRTQ